MSKETYVGGDIIEWTGGNNLSFAKEEIINSSNNANQELKKSVMMNKAAANLPIFLNTAIFADVEVEVEPY